MQCTSDSWLSVPTYIIDMGPVRQQSSDPYDYLHEYVTLACGVFKPALFRLLYVDGTEPVVKSVYLSDDGDGVRIVLEDLRLERRFGLRLPPLRLRVPGDTRISWDIINGVMREYSVRQGELF